MESNMLFSQSCRVCSSEYENGINVFGAEGKKLYLETKIRKYLYITVTLEDRLPKIICDNCCKKLDGIHKFATMANKMQDKFNKLVINSQNDTIMEPKQNENKGLLHTYLTNGIKEKDNNVQPQDLEVTEMEVRVDPMLVLQYSFTDEDEYMSDNDSRTSQEKYMENENNIEDMFESNYHHKPYICHSCPRRFTSEIALQSHMWCHLPKLKRVLVTNYNNAICGLENKDDKNIDGQNMFDKSSSNQPDDAEIADNDSCVRFTCPICGKIISTKGNLKVHLETHRPKGKYACDICGRIFKTQCNLHRHKEYHKGIQFPCGVCGRVYPTNSTLRAHSITHSNLRPHKCPLCDKTFKRNQDLKFHINQHTGARPYQCPYCPKAFASSGNCFSHRKRMHPIEVERDRERAAKIMR